MARRERIVGPQEIARMLGVNRQRVFQLAATRDFPEPWEVLAACKVWAYSDVKAWARKRGRQLND